MITCPKCTAAEWKQLHRSPVDPAEDKFRCSKCGHEFLRYDPLVPHPTYRGINMTEYDVILIGGGRLKIAATSAEEACEKARADGYRVDHAESGPLDYGDCPPDKWDANWPPFQG